MKKIAFAGSFDPLTNGHLWVIEEGLNIAQEVLVIIAHNNAKKGLFTDLQRKSMIDEVINQKGWAERVTTIILKNEYVAQFALQQDCEYMIRGIRSAVDFDYESLIQGTNVDVLSGAKTIFVMPPGELESVSSSFIKNLVGPIGWHWNIKRFLPEPIYMAWIKKYITDFFINHCKSLNENSQNELLKHVFEYYTQPPRHYHNLDHILHAIQELEWVNAHHSLAAKDIEKILLAILGHDLIYNTIDKGDISDEQASANWIKDFLSKFNYQGSQEIAEMIEKTQYLANKEIIPQTENEKLLCSIDLAILGQMEHQYNNYTKSIKSEYSHVDNDLYTQGRLFALEKLLAKEKLYLHEYFTHYESRARKNITQELIRLKK